MPRLLGQDCRIILTAGSSPIKSIAAIKDINFTIKGEAVKSDYLGDKGPKYDEVFDGIEFKLTNEIDTDEYFDLLTRLIKRKQGVENFQVNLSARFNFRTGKRRIATIVDVSFGDIPLEIPERKQKVRSGLTGYATTISFPRGV